MDSEAPGAALTNAVVQSAVRDCWEDALLFDDFDDDDNFFDIGGHSLLIADILAGVGARLGLRIPLMDFFDHPTVNGLSRHLQASISVGQRNV